MIDLGKVMTKYLGMSESAVDCAFSHGQVKLDGRTLPMSMRRIAYSPVRGMILTAAGRQIALGARPLDPAPPLF